MTESKPTDLATIKTGGRGLQLTTLNDMERWAKGVIASGLAPDSLDTAPKVIVATQYGLELGLSPMVAMNSICVVRGKATLWGDAALALVRKSGFLFEFSEEVTGTGESMEAKVRSVRKDANGATFEVKTTFSVEDARTATLWGKTGPWKTHPKRMLKYKARAFNLRDNFPDVLEGMHLTEEMEGEEIEPLPAPECDTPTRGDRRKKVPSETLQPPHLEELAQTSTVPPVKSAEPVTEDAEDGNGSAGEEEASPEEVAEFVAETPKLKAYNDLHDEYDEKGGDNFTEWAAEVLCVGEDEVDSPECFTVEKIEQLKLHLANEGV